MDSSRIDNLLIDLHKIEKLLMEMREAEIYPASLLNQIFTLNLGFLEKLHALEEAQVQLLREQMAEHQRLIDSINRSGVAMAEPEVKAVDVEPVLEPETRPEPKPEEPVIPKVEEPAPVVVAEPELKPVERQEPPVVQQAPEAHKPVESAATSKISLNDVIEKKSLTDFRKAISLNDWFRFKRDLFKGNEEAINATVQALNGIGSYEEAIAYLNEHVRWDPDDPTAADFIKLLEKRFL